ncbi:MAG: hypothetical protein ACR2G2_11620 [Pseudonocardia sp.]
MLGARDGVHVGAWAAVDADCSITCLALDDGAELSFGGPSGPMSITVSADALETLIATASQALRTPRS